MKTAAQLAALVGGRLEGDGALEISGVAGLEAAGATQASFYGNKKYKAQLEASSAGVIFVGKDAPPRGARTFIVVENPHLAFAKAGQAFSPPKQYAPGIAPRANVHANAKVHPTATVMDFATVNAGAEIGEGAVLFPGVYVGENARIGAGTRLSANVAVMDGCVVGARCLLHPSAVVGADGFGFALDMSVPAHVKIPQTGIVRIEDDVEIGACSCVDRATTGETVVGRGTKIDNLVQVGHNSTIGPLSILCAQVGLSGTTELGQGVVLAGQVGIAGHLRIGDLAQIAAQSGIMSDVDDGEVMLGSPAMPKREYLRMTAVQRKLPELQKQLRELQERLAALEKGKTP